MYRSIILYILFLFFCLNSHANPVFKQLQILNTCWSEHKDVNLTGFDTDNYHTSEEWIRLHLYLVEQTLRKADLQNLTNEQKANRLSTLDYLHEYMLAGRFPQNEDYAYQTPIFIDKHDNFCAVGYLIKASGHEAISRKIAATANLAYVREMKYPKLFAWAKEYGFTIDELAWIQPGYPSYSSVMLPVGYSVKGSVNDLFVDSADARLYVGGSFSYVDSIITASNISYLTINGTGYSWHKMGSGVNGPVTAIARYKNNIYVAGKFTIAGGKKVDNIAVWNGTSWESAGCLNGKITKLITFDNELYAAGLFEICGGASNVNFAHWDGSQWIPINGLSGTVNTMKAFGNTLYLGGKFSYGASPVNAIKWDALSGFHSFSNGIINDVTDFAKFYDTIYASCIHTTSVDKELLYQLAGNTWQPYGDFNLFSKYVNTLAVNSICVLGDTFLVGGDFSAIAGSMKFTLGCMNIEFPYTQHVKENFFDANGIVKKMTVFNNEVFIGGEFSDYIYQGNKLSFFSGIGKRIYYDKPDYFQANIDAYTSCNGQNGTAQLSHIYGTAPYKYLWSTGDTTIAINTATPGTYSVDITDGLTNVHTYSITVGNVDVDTAVIANSTYLMAQDSVSAYQWMACDNNQLVPNEILRQIKPVITGDYAVIINSDGCIDTSGCYHIIGTDIPKTATTNEYLIYPNPYRNELNLTFKNALPGRIVRIAGITGSIFIEESIHTGFVALNTKNLAPAVYILTIEENGVTVYQTKIVKE